MENKNNKFDAILGIIIIAGLITGIGSLVAAFFAFFNYDWVGTGVCLGAAALSFGLIANAILRS